MTLRGRLADRMRWVLTTTPARLKQHCCNADWNEAAKSAATVAFKDVDSALMKEYQGIGDPLRNSKH